MKVTKEDRKQLKRVLKGIARKKNRETIFYDLCFCICAPQTTFKNNFKVIQELKDFNLYGRKDVRYSKLYKWYYIPKLRTLLKPVRFYNNKAKYLLEAKKNFNNIMLHVNIYLKSRELKGEPEPTSPILIAGAMRQYLVERVKGLGMKTASHFLRNLGETNLAIIDVHIIKFLAEHVINFTSHKTTYEQRVIYFSKLATNKREYRWLERRFRDLAKKYKLSVAELDALVWKQYSNTNWKDFGY